MKKQYLSAKRLSLWMRLTKKWNTLYSKLKTSANSINLKKLNALSITLGVKRKIALTALAGAVTLGAQAQMVFEEVSDRRIQIFREPLEPGNASSPEFIDADGDGDYDLVVGNQDGILEYYENTPTGFLEIDRLDGSPFRVATSVLGGFASPAFTDLDGDGDLDLVVGKKTSNDLRHYKKTDTGYQVVFVREGSPFHDFDRTHSSPTFIDIDEDGNTDLIMGGEDGTISYHRNTGTEYVEQTGTNNPFDAIDIGAYSSPEFADINGDGRIDLIIGDNKGLVNFYENTTTGYVNKTGGLNPFNDINLGIGGRANPDLHDVDNDGDLDLVLGTLNQGIKYYLNTNGVYEEQLGTNNPFGGIDVGSSADIIFNDVDEDGDMDLVAGSRDGTIKYFQNYVTGFRENTGAINPFDGIISSTDYYPSPVFTDIDEDGDLDLIVGDGWNTLKYFENSSSVFTEKTNNSNPFNSISQAYSPTFVDVDGDSDLDLVTTDYYGGLLYYQNSGNDYVQQTGTDNPFDHVVGSYYGAPTFADVDGDGDLDLVYGTWEKIKLYSNTATGYVEQTGTDNPFDGLPFDGYIQPEFVDIDNDGDLDLFVGAENGHILEFTNVYSGPTGLLSDKRNTESLNIFPNPAKSIINTEEGHLEILDALGYQVLSTNSTGTVDISALESGIYFAVQNGKRTKLIIE